MLKKYKRLWYFIPLPFLFLCCCWSMRFYLLLQPASSFPLNLTWQIDLGRSTYERPAYQSDLVLFPANNFVTSRWYGIEATTGEVVWSQPVQRNSFRRCLTPEYLVVAGRSSFMTLKPRTGEVIWAQERANTATCSKTLVFAVLTRGTLRAINLSNGHEPWSETTPSKGFYGVIYDSETGNLVAKAATLPGDMYIIEAESGRLSHSFDKVVYAPEEGERGPMYLIDRGQLFLGGTVLDAQTGDVIHKEDFYGTNTPPTVTADTMYLTSGYATVAFDRTTYNIKWVYPQKTGFGIPPQTLSPLAILDGVGYVIYSDATLRAIDLETGQGLGYWQPSLFDRWRWPVCAPFPFPFCTARTGVGMATSEDTLFVSLGDGKLYAFRE